MGCCCDSRVNVRILEDEQRDKLEEVASRY